MISPRQAVRWDTRTLFRPYAQEQSVKELQEEHRTNPEQVYEEAIDVRLPHGVL